MSRRYLVTGGAGFIGSSFIRYLLEHEPDAEITNLDAMKYAGVRATVDELDANDNHKFVLGDICDSLLVDQVVPEHDVIVHFAAESHVDRSITDPSRFLETNFVGTGVLLEAARKHGTRRFIHISTDEVYGSIEDGFAVEDAVLNPSSPYSSSKAGADLLVLSYQVTHDLDVVVTRCTNNFGPYQYPEKVLPLFITNLLEGKKVPVYGTGENERDWLYVTDHCSALHLLVDEAAPGEIYNIGANAQITNFDLTKRILAAFDRDETWIDWVADRPGHDLRYALDTSKLRNLGWEPVHDFDQLLSDTIEWYRSRPDWWAPLKERTT